MNKIATISAERTATLKAVLPQKVSKVAIKALEDLDGSIDDALETLAPDVRPRVELAYRIAAVSEDHLPLVKALVADEKTKSLRDIALNFNVTQLAELVDPNDLPEDAPGDTEDQKRLRYAAKVRDNLFNVETSAVLQRMTDDKEIPMKSDDVRVGVRTFLGNLPEFNIRTTSAYKAFADPQAFAEIPTELQADVVENVKILQRVQAMSTSANAVPVLVDSGLHSALSVSQLPESTFMAAYSGRMEPGVAAEVYNNALNIHLRNEHALMTMHETMRGAGPAIVRGQLGTETEARQERTMKMQRQADERGVPLNLENLFHDMDYCECDDCLSVYSPASYFVEVLQYLRNNDLNPENPRTGQAGIAGTPLEVLFKRRPDIGCLELTCENTFVALPYIDLATEVMESFVVHSRGDADFIDHVKLEVFNVDDETSEELIAQPQHVNYEAYCILKNAVYPFTLPYHQPIDVARIWLKYMGTTRFDLLRHFQTAHEPTGNLNLTDAQRHDLDAYHQQARNLAETAELLGMTQEEFIILTKQAFWPKAYFDLTQGQNHTVEEYLDKIGVRPGCRYYGYGTSQDMLSVDEVDQVGLTFVKKQFLPRTGLMYAELVELLKTRWINPCMPEGRALAVLQSIRLSYRFLQTLVDPHGADDDAKYGKLIDALDRWQPLVPSLDAMLHPDPCHEHLKRDCVDKADFRAWVLCYFERIGKLIVLESGEGPRLSEYGDLYRLDSNEKVGELRPDGTIVGENGDLIGRVNYNLDLVDLENKPLVSHFNPVGLDLRAPDGSLIVRFFLDKKMDRKGRFYWIPAKDTCDLDRTRLVHLDGTHLEKDEYERIHRFVRLWRKLGWTIPEVDQAICGSNGDDFGGPEPGGGIEPGDEPVGFVSFDEFKDDCADAPEGEGCCDDPPLGAIENCPDVPNIPDHISPALLRQLAAITMVMEQTGLELEKQLTFWSNIGTYGEKSLYKRLFLTHNLVHIDDVFEADTNGNYLGMAGKISEHIPVLLAAFKVKVEDIAAIMAYRNLPDALTLHGLSVLYRHFLLSKILHVKPVDLPGAIDLFGDPFVSPQASKDFLKVWGSMEDAGFTFPQLNYVIKDRVDPNHPLAPTDKAVVGLAKTLYDGLSAIDRDNADVPVADPANPTADELALFTDEAVRQKAGLLYSTETVEAIVGLLDGTTVYTTNAPANLNLDIPEALAPKVKYVDNAALQITGILTADEILAAKALSNNANWAKAIDRAGKQPHHFFDETIAGIFPDPAEAANHLLAGDVNVPFDPADPAAFDANTAPLKRFYFLGKYLPFLRQSLESRFIVSTLATVGGVTPEVAEALLSDILLVGAAPNQKSALEAFRKIKDQPAGPPAGWKGDLIPTKTDTYTFYAVNSDNQPAPLVIDGTPVPFAHQQDDPSNVWWTDPVPFKLKAGTVYTFDSGGLLQTQLRWKTDATPVSPIPAAALLPDYASAGTRDALTRFVKATIVANGFKLAANELEHMQTNGQFFNGLDFNALTIAQWKRLCAYTTLRDSLPKAEKSLIDLFAWAMNPSDPALLSEMIAKATLWKQERIESLIAPEHFDLDDPTAFRDERSLVKLQQSLKIVDDIGVDIPALFRWADPSSRFWQSHKIAQDIQANLRARYDQTDWEKVVEPLYDELRSHQQEALVQYLLVLPQLKEWGVVDVNSLFEFFLIDVQMDPCMKTSRIKQATSTAQLFVQRCMLGLETPHVRPDVLDRKRWEWMSRYRVWEANRKVFLYPENWIKSELRDDKSPFYQELESDLLQKDITTPNVEDALKNYLFKVDEVANLLVVGLHLEQARDSHGALISEGGRPVYSKLHVFGRTQNEPHQFFYRYYDVPGRNWYPWSKMAVDIPSYNVENEDGEIVSHGTYIAPVVWNGRLLVFFPEFTKKTQQAKLRIDAEGGGTRVPTTVERSQSPFGDISPSEIWQIKIGWTELRNGKWMQKQVSKDALYDFDIVKLGINQYHLTTYWLSNLKEYQIVPRVITGASPEVIIDVYRDRNFKSGFHFEGSQIVRVDGLGPHGFVADQAEFHFEGNALHSFQAKDGDSAPLAKTAPYCTKAGMFQLSLVESVPFRHTFAHDLLSCISTKGLDPLFDYFAHRIPANRRDDAFGATTEPARYGELKRPYSIYNWEAAFHAPMQLGGCHIASQNFEQGLKMYHYVLNPYADGTDAKRFWMFPPFKEIDGADSLEALFLNLQPNQPDDRINEWRDNAFQPHVVARSRPASYMKWVAMEYIKALIAYGDYYFRQNTLETIPMAIQCYVLASHIYGPQGEAIPKRGTKRPETYNSLLDKWDAFGNAMVELELAFPFSNQTALPMGIGSGAIGLPNVFGFATSLYFCIPDNPNLRELKETIDDRLFKIRHCEDINGVFRQLPLFEPPIDPAMLVQAAAAGLSISSVLNDLSSPMPNYRFSYLLQRALDLCSELKALGNNYLSIKEKRDSEALALLRAKHESAIQNLVMEVRKQQVDEAQKAIEALQQSRMGPVYRLQHYLKLIGEDLAKVPAEDGDFAELPDSIEKPIDESGLKLISFEKEELDKSHAAADWSIGIGVVETLASVFHALPTMKVDGHPLGVGASVSWGFPNLANATSAVARGLKTYADNLSYQSADAGRKAGFLRQLQDRVQQANTAGYEIKNIDRQILTAQIRIDIANQEMTNQQKQIDNALEAEDFLRNKYTNGELYSWMDNQVRGLFYQAYTTAYDLAKKAEKVFRFERGLSTSDFIQFGYWDGTHDGLLSGERLYVGLKQLEKAYLETRGHDFEVSKSISLRQIDPGALLDLREKGVCEFELPEVLFDMDWPGHYGRRIKSVSIRIPCVTGPYTGLNCTLRLLEHKIRIKPSAKDKSAYPENTADGSTDERFMTVNVPINAIAVSSQEEDSGMFDLSFHDERYMPFEGAGVISKWRAELPRTFRQFDYDTITDVIVRIRYTSMDGGDKLRSAAQGALQDYIEAKVDLSENQGLFAAFDLKNDFPNEWYTATHPTGGSTDFVLTLDKLSEKLPLFTKGATARATDFYLLTSTNLAAADIVATQEGTDLAFSPGPARGSMKMYTANSDPALKMDSLKLSFPLPNQPIEKMWLVQRYLLT